MPQNLAKTSAFKRTGRTPKTSEYVARDLAVHILAMKMPEGTRLPTERELLDKLGVGRSTLREALRLLETRGVITIRSGRQGGPVVRRPRPTDLSESLALLLSFESVSLLDVLEAREAFEPMIARLAARNATTAQLAVMSGVVDSMAGILDDHARFREQAAKFLTTLAGSTGNPVLRVTGEALLGLHTDAIAGIETTPRRRRIVADAHRRIFEALSERDELKAEAQMRAHRREISRLWRTQHANLFETQVLWNDLGRATTPNGGQNHADATLF